MPTLAVVWIRPTFAETILPIRDLSNLEYRLGGSSEQITKSRPYARGWRPNVNRADLSPNTTRDGLRSLSVEGMSASRQLAGNYRQDQGRAKPWSARRNGGP